MAPINKAFESYMRVTHGFRYSLERDIDGNYAREVVKRMFEVYRLYYFK